MEDLFGKPLVDLSDEELDVILKDNKIQEQADALVQKKHAAEAEAYRRKKAEVDAASQSYQLVEELLRKNHGANVKITLEVIPSGKVKKRKCMIEIGDQVIGSNRDIRNKRENLVRTFGLLSTDINRLENQKLQGQFKDTIARERMKR